LLSTLVIQLFLKPDPYLTARSMRGESGSEKRQIKKALSHIVENPRALFAILAISTGHIAMVTIMVMTPVHMKHVDVTLTIIGLVISIHVLGMYAFSPLVGSLSDRIGRVNTIRIGVVTLLLAAVVAGRAHADDATQLGIGLFLLGLGWSFTLIAGSTFLTESVVPELKTSAQGASDLVMNLSGAFGGAIAGVVIATLSYGWLCALAAIPVSFLGIWSLRIVKAKR
jgi:MFS family permease